MSGWNDYTSRLKLHGESMRERHTARLVNKLKSDLPGLISTKKLVLYYPGSSVPVSQTATVLYADELNTRKIRTMPGETFVGGAVVEFENATWLITSVDAESEIYQKADMERCNYVLKWENEARELITRPCIISDVTRYLVGENAKQQMVIGDSRMSLRIAKDDQTAKIKRGSRFIVDDLDSGESIAYEVTKPDRITYRFGGDGMYAFLIRETNVLPSDDTSENITTPSQYKPDTPNDDGGWF